MLSKTYARDVVVLHGKNGLLFAFFQWLPNRSVRSVLAHTIYVHPTNFTQRLFSAFLKEHPADKVRFEFRDGAMTVTFHWDAQKVIKMQSRDEQLYAVKTAPSLAYLEGGI